MTRTIEEVAKEISEVKHQREINEDAEVEEKLRTKNNDLRQEFIKLETGDKR